MKPLPKLSERTVETMKGVLKGASKGGAIAAAASIATGAAVIVTAPAWVPIVGGTMVVSAATVATWTVIGTALGATSGGVRAFLKKKKLDDDFEREFG